MSEYVHGWRRKIGVVTLLMALIFMAGWVRSGHQHDDLIIPTDEVTSIQFVSACRSFIVVTTSVSDRSIAGVQQIGWSSQPASDEKWSFHLGELLSTTKPPNAFRFISVGVGGGKTTYRATMFSFPYWSIVVPLTLLSAFLLFSRPRTSNQNKISEPNAETVA